MYSGDKVTIYDDPLERTTIEGYADLIALLKPEVGIYNGEVLQQWRVLFDTDSTAVNRLIAVKIIGKTVCPAGEQK